jgi:hypothetical protein
VERAQGVGDLFDLVDGGGGGLGDLLELPVGAGFAAGGPQSEQGAVFDDDQALAQAVVQFRRDAFSLGLLRFE